MRLIVAFVFAACLSAFAQCSNTSYGNGFTCVQYGNASNAGAGATSTVTLTGNTTTGNTVVVFSSVCGNLSCTAGLSSMSLDVSNGASDSKAEIPGSPSVVGDIFKKSAWVFSSVSATSTFTVSVTGGTPYYLVVDVVEIAGAATSSPLDVSQFGSASTGTSLSITTGSTGNATDMVIGQLGTLSGISNLTMGAGFTAVAANKTVMAKTVSSAGAQTCNWTWTNNRANIGACVVIKNSSAKVRRRALVIQ